MLLMPCGTLLRPGSSNFQHTSGIKAINETVFNDLTHAFEKPGGCKEKTIKCREKLLITDPNDWGDMEEAKKVCEDTHDYCDLHSPTGVYLNISNRGWYDIAHPKADPFPEPYLRGYLSQGWVQAALGVPVNYSAQSMVVNEAFQSTNDIMRGGYLEEIADLLDNGLKVTLMYGDRDFACNWIGGEMASLAVNYSGSEQFKNAGYTPLISPVGIGGQTRQYGNFSFSRVYQAGHEVPSYQPEIAYAIFLRALFNRDIATGALPLTDDYTTIGPSSTWHIKNAIPEVPEPQCYILNAETCTEEQWDFVKNGSVIVRDFSVVEYLKEATLGREPIDDEAQYLLKSERIDL